MKPGSQPPILLAQFKAYHSIDETLEIIQTLINEQAASNMRLHFSVPYSFLEPLNQKLAGSKAVIGAEIMLNTDEGAFTSTVAGKLLLNAGAKFVLIGDLDERKVYAPSSETIKNKIEHALEWGLMPVVCIGETLEQFHAGVSKEVLQAELVESLGELSAEQLFGLHILYDAPWINRTPFEAASEELTKAYHMVREALIELFIDEVANEFKIIYAVPTFSTELPQLMKSLPASGYSLGILTSSAAEMKHLIPPLTFCEEDPEVLKDTSEQTPEKVAKKLPRKRKTKAEKASEEASANDKAESVDTANGEGPVEKKKRAPRTKKTEE